MSMRLEVISISMPMCLKHANTNISMLEKFVSIFMEFFLGAQPIISNGKLILDLLNEI